MRIPRLRRRPAAIAIALAGLGMAAAVPAAGATSPPSTRAADSGTVSWSSDLTRVTSDDVNVTVADGALRVKRTSFSPASAQAGRGYGSQVLAPRKLDHPVNRVTAGLTGTALSAARVAVDVRGRDATGAWTEWTRADQAEAVLARSVTTVQARITFTDERGRARVRGLKLTAEQGPAPRTAAAATAFSARVYATREGLVGGTTANGHVITANDHFVALPSRRGLSPQGSSEYAVKVCGPTRCEVAPVWDVGPWNIHDDYWNPSSIRESFKDLPQGRPEAQAAYQDGYNGGKDGFGRTVLNPAGIDLADGTFYNVGLNNNGWVTVTYLWTGTSGKQFPTWGTDVNIRKQANTSSSVVAQLSGPTTVGVSCQVHGERITVDGITNDGWAYLPDYGGYISNIFIDVPESWLPGVPTC